MILKNANAANLSAILLAIVVLSCKVDMVVDEGVQQLKTIEY
jgi:hypothetical protein